MHIIAKYAKRVDVNAKVLAEYSGFIPAGKEHFGFTLAIEALYEVAEELAKYADELYGTSINEE